MRRITRITTVGIASAALALSATACGKSSTDSGSSSSSSDSKTITAAIAYDIGGRGDQSFNDAAYAGLQKAEKELGVKGKEAEPSEGEGDADKVQRLTALARSGSNPVIGVGFAYAPAIAKVAKAYPKTTFGLIDDTSVTAPNIANLVFNGHFCGGSGSVGNWTPA
ncbi:BMP family ABC transporter substrate-binding protein, partial [Streptomyces sp. NPDC006324]|uniref:BMP family lipoprotein n=1 Tax=Streptomyces sp. NPDC006324 TaxID=3156751 RepID=UPI0033BBC266